MRSRPLALLLIVFVLLTSFFIVPVSAASRDNLIDSDLNNWQNTDGSDTVSVYSKADIYRVSGSGSSTSGYMIGILYDLPSFIAGHSYTLSFKLPSGTDISNSWGLSWTDEQTISYYNNASVFVGYGFLSADGTTVDTQKVLYEFNSGNISRFLGQTCRTTFVAESSSGRPVVYIGLTAQDTKIHHFYFSDFLLFDNDDTSKELSGIKGFLHSIRWDLTGGVCDDEECPHSFPDDPHISLFSELSNSIESHLQGLIDSVESFFTGLGNLLLYFNWDGEYENPFENENDTVENLSIELKKVSDYVAGVGDSIENIIDSLSGSLELLSMFVERFDWLISICVFTLSIIVISRFIGL